MWKPAGRRGAQPTLQTGGCIFAEAPDRSARQARIFWIADLDPAVLPVDISAAQASGPDSIDLSVLAPWLSLVRSATGQEHALLSDGARHIRIDVEQGSFAQAGPVTIRFHVTGYATARARVAPLRRFLDLVRRGRFSRSLYPPDPRLQRHAALLRVHDAISAGATQREIGVALFGAGRIEKEWDGASDSLRLRVRRLARDARAMARGGYRLLLRKSGHYPD